MKLGKINILTAIAFVAAITFGSCKKDDGPIPNNIVIENIPLVSVNLESSSTVFTAPITFSDQGSFQGKFKFSMYFPDKTPPAKIDVVARKRNSGAVSPIKVIKADVTTLPASFTITAADLATLFGGPLALKDSIDIAPDLYVGSKKYEAWPASGAVGSGAGVVGMSGVGFGEKITYIVK